LLFSWILNETRRAFNLTLHTVTGIVACVHLLKSSSIKRLLIFLLLIILKEASKRKAHVWGNYTAQSLRSKVNNISTQKRLRRNCAMWHAIQKLIILMLKERHAMSTFYIFCTDNLWKWELTQFEITPQRLWITGKNTDGSDRCLFWRNIWAI